MPNVDSVQEEHHQEAATVYAELSHLISLVTYGNLCLATPGAAGRTQLLTGLSRTPFERQATIRFLSDDGITVESGEAWLQYLRSSRTDRLRLVLRPSPRPGEAASTGREWALQVLSPERTSLWVSNWETEPQQVRRWRVTYSEHRLDAALPDMPRDLVEAARQLQLAVDAAMGFARAAGRTAFAARLDESLALSRQGAAEPQWLSDLLPASRGNPEARLLLAFAARAFVFGGMGSWNDFGSREPEVQQAFTSVTNRLWHAWLTAVTVSTNAFDVGGGPR